VGESRWTTHAQAIARIPDGCTVAVGGAGEPVSLVRELIRQRKRVRVFALEGGLCAQLLAGSGLALELWRPPVRLPDGGADSARTQDESRAEESARIEEQEAQAGDGVWPWDPAWPEEILRPEGWQSARAGDVLAQRLRAAAEGRPWAVVDVPAKLADVYPMVFRRLDDPFGGAPVTAAAPLRPDVALLHAARADGAGRVQADPAGGVDHTLDWLLAQTARTVIVSAEQMVSPQAVDWSAGRCSAPGRRADWVVEAPYGAWPCGYASRYRPDREGLDAFRRWAARPREEAAWLAGFTAPGDWYACLEKLGLDRLLAHTVNRRGE
jgi:glutaconate CoA-transferase subunit A